MSNELPSLSSREAIAAFQRAGFDVVRSEGSHSVMKKPGHRYVVSVPKRRTLATGTLRSLIKDAGLTPEQFRALL